MDAIGNIATIVVTYNRKELLIRCLNAISCQTRKPQFVYIVDNASSDGTIDVVKQSGYYNSVVDGIDFVFIELSKNIGGAGGFYEGLRTAHKNASFNAFWLMDDDGEPEEHCLEELVRFIDKRDYVAPIVLSDVDRKSCSFVPDTDYETFCKKADERGIVENWASPFNGILFSRRLVDKIGYPKKEMFIWGDEINYQLRAERAGFRRMTTIRAIHYHPIDRQKIIRNEDTLNAYLVVADSRWKQYCYIRNRMYNMMFERKSLYRKIRINMYLCKAYKNYFKKTLGNNSMNNLVNDAFWSGTLGLFGGLNRYR